MSSEIKGEDLTVSFAFMGSYYWGVEEDHYQVSLWLVKDEWDAGTTDDILITEDILEDSLKYEDESWVWWPVSYHLPEEIGNTKVRLAFRYQGRDGAQFCLDKICIKGFQGENNKCSLDVNEDGQITPHDALCIYERSLNQCPTSCGSCEDVCCDVDNNGKCSSSDASFVFEAYLKGQVVY